MQYTIHTKLPINIEIDRVIALSGTLNDWDFVLNSEQFGRSKLMFIGVTAYLVEEVYYAKILFTDDVDIEYEYLYAKIDFNKIMELLIDTERSNCDS